KHPEPSHVTVAFDGSRWSDEAIRWAAQEAGLRGLPLRIVNAWLPLPMPGGRAVSLAESRALLDAAEVRAHVYGNGIAVSVVSAADTVGATLAAESESCAMLVLGSRGRGGFRSLLLGSTSLTAASVARCPVVVVRDPAPTVDPGPASDVVLGLEPRQPADELLDFAFTAAAARSGRRLHGITAWTVAESARDGGPILDRDAIETAVTRAADEALAGWRTKYPEVEVRRTVVHASPAGALVEASEWAALTVVGRRHAGTPLGLRLGTVAHAVLLHAHGSVAVVPY
ncbi:MAG: universal stress protein, partial [Streptomycetaceae bacterium]|nr:universal stress protein [Streptomycetaceae bacterium]